MVECPEYIIALLSYIRDELDRLYWNKFQEEWDDNPFSNSGNVEGFNNGTFEVHAYDWKYGLDDEDDDDEQPNFKYKDIEIIWYKYLGRGTRINREVYPEEVIDMFNKCMASLQNGWNDTIEH